MAAALPEREDQAEPDVRLLFVRGIDGGRGWAEGDWTVRFAPGALARFFGERKAQAVRNGYFLVRGRALGPVFVVEAVLHRQSIRSPDGAAVLLTEPTGEPPGFICRWVRAEAEDLDEPAIVRKARRRRRAGDADADREAE